MSDDDIGVFSHREIDNHEFGVLGGGGKRFRYDDEAPAHASLVDANSPLIFDLMTRLVTALATDHVTHVPSDTSPCHVCDSIKEAETMLSATVAHGRHLKGL